MCLSAFVSGLGCLEMGHHQLPIIIIIVCITEDSSVPSATTSHDADWIMMFVAYGMIDAVNFNLGGGGESHWYKLLFKQISWLW